MLLMIGIVPVISVEEKDIVPIALDVYIK